MSIANASAHYSAYAILKSDSSSQYVGTARKSQTAEQLIEQTFEHTSPIRPIHATRHAVRRITQDEGELIATNGKRQTENHQPALKFRFDNILTKNSV